MSLKNGRKNKRKSVEETKEFKLPVLTKEMNKSEDLIVEIEEDLKSNNEEEKSSVEEAGRVTRSRSNTPLKKSLNSSESSENELNISLNDSNGHEDFKNSEKLDENGTQDKTPEENVVPEECPEVDLELHLEENPDLPSDSESSPILGRCTTRRSQNRNIPTPKTPKPNNEIIPEHNGEEVVIEAESEAIIISDELEEPESECVLIIPEQNEEVSVTNESEPIEITESETSEKTDINESSDSSISTRVHVGSDLPREVDVPLPEDKETFLSMNKDLSVLESLRRLRPRSAIHANTDYRRNLLKSNAEKIDYSHYSPLQSIERLPGRKHKQTEELPDGPKRLKLGSPSKPTLISYIASPFNKLRSKFSGEEVNTRSTPKLTNYKEHDLTSDFDNTEVSVAEEAMPVEEKKWCSIM